MSWGGWSIEPPLAYVAIAAMLYWLGGRGYACGGAAASGGIIRGWPRDDRARARFAARRLREPALLGAHVQHVLLLTVAPPLILLGRPWPRMWRALSLESRTTDRASARAGPWTAPAARVGPPAAGMAPIQRDAARLAHPGGLRRNPALGRDPPARARDVLFYGAVVLGACDRPRAVASAPGVAGADRCVLGSMIVGWILAITLVVVPDPLYWSLRRDRPPARRDLGADRPAARRRDDVGAGLDRLRSR